MISHRIFGCLFLILLSQYGDAYKSHYVESILNSLQRIEHLLNKAEVKQAEEHPLNCLIPAEKLFDLISELSKVSNNESIETQAARKYWAPVGPDNILILRRALGLEDERSVEQLSPRIQKQRNKNKNRNENININTNTNKLFARRTLDEGISHHLNKDQNRNVNYNANTNTNLNKNSDILDLVDSNDEEDEK